MGAANEESLSVRAAMAQHAKGEFATARVSLEEALADCGGDPDGLGCRAVVASGLGSLLQRQAAADRPNAEALTRRAVGYYDRVLRENPNQPDALYGKVLAYRALGPHEEQESFYAEAPGRDSSRLAVYRSFQGDYYAAIRRWPAGVAAYRRALVADPDDDGARSGLVEALGASGQLQQWTCSILGASGTCATRLRRERLWCRA
jgi:tetratricopeptide (TPR) repeat protein